MLYPPARLPRPKSIDIQILISGALIFYIEIILLVGKKNHTQTFAPFIQKHTHRTHYIEHKICVYTSDYT